MTSHFGEINETSFTPEVNEHIIQLLKENYKDYDYYGDKYKVHSDGVIGRGGFGEVIAIIAEHDTYETYVLVDSDPEEEQELNIFKPVQKEYPTGKGLVVKRVDIKLEENYSDESVSHTSNTDRKNILHFVQCCQEAVLQSDILSHPNIVQVYDKWIQKNQKKSNEQVDYASDILTIVEFLEKSDPQKPQALTSKVRAALNNTEGKKIIQLVENTA